MFVEINCLYVVCILNNCVYYEMYVIKGLYVMFLLKVDLG